MLVQDIMQQPVITTEAHAPITEAYETMHQQEIRHLPVLEAGTLVGVITDRDIRFATSPFHPAPVQTDVPVAEVMAEDPVTAGPLDPIEEAAHLMRDQKIGCLPVLDGDELVGIVTGTDLLDALIRLTGLAKPGGRLAVSLRDEPGQLADLTARIAREGLDIRSVLSYYEDEMADPPRQRFIFRIDTLNLHPLARTLRDEGFEVVWPREKPIG